MNRTIFVVVNASDKRSVAAGVSNLELFKRVLIECHDLWWLGDTVLFYGKDGIVVCEDVGKYIATVSNYQGHKVNFHDAIEEGVEQLTGCELPFIVGLSDVAVRMPRKVAVKHYIGGTGTNKESIKDFLASKGEDHPSINSDCSPLVF